MCQRIFQVSAPVNCVCLHPNQVELIVGDQSGIIHLWHLKTNHNEQLVSFFLTIIFLQRLFIDYVMLNFSFFNPPSWCFCKAGPYSLKCKNKMTLRSLKPLSLPTYSITFFMNSPLLWTGQFLGKQSTNYLVAQSCEIASQLEVSLL